jgi:hypothetical protein
MYSNSRTDTIITVYVYLFLFLSLGELCCNACSSQTAVNRGESEGEGGEKFSREEAARFVNDEDPKEGEGQGQGEEQGEGHWQSLLLIIPLRLGLTDINPIYFDALKVGMAFKTRELVACAVKERLSTLREV